METIIHSNFKNRIRYEHNHDYFDNVDCEEKAYILGFLIADGTLEIVKTKNRTSNRICFLNSVDDLETVELIRNQISPNSMLYYRNNTSGVKVRKEQVSLRITSKKMCDVLVNKYNILPRKTYHSDFIFDFNTIPEKYHSSFIRGYFDGDGSVSFYKTKNTLYFNFSFISTSLPFLNQISKIFEEKFNVRPIIKNISGKTCEYHTLRFDYNRNRTEIVKCIYNYLYKDSKCFLTRKKVKFEEYFEYRANSSVNKLE